MFFSLDFLSHRLHHVMNPFMGRLGASSLGGRFTLIQSTASLIHSRSLALTSLQYRTYATRAPKGFRTSSPLSTKGGGLAYRKRRTELKAKLEEEPVDPFSIALNTLADNPGAHKRVQPPPPPNKSNRCSQYRTKNNHKMVNKNRNARWVVAQDRARASSAGGAPRAKKPVVGAKCARALRAVRPHSTSGSANTASAMPRASSSPRRRRVADLMGDRGRVGSESGISGSTWATCRSGLTADG